MKKLENTKLDEIGKALVKADAISSREIEKIVGNSALFDSVRERIAATTSGTGPRRSHFRPGGAVLASIAVVAAALGFVVFRSGPETAAVDSAPAEPKKAEINRSEEPDVLVDPLPLPAPEPAKIGRVTNRPGVRTSRPRRAEIQQVPHVANFYAVSYAGDPHETERGGRIVRVDIPRSTLLAMGVYIPLENESATVKADLLVGSDGVTRGIRVVE